MSIDLPGMWEEADLSGGATDMVASDTAGDCYSCATEQCNTRYCPCSCHGEIAICGHESNGEPIGPHDKTEAGRCGCPCITCALCGQPRDLNTHTWVGRQFECLEPKR